MIEKATLNDVPELNTLVNSAYRGESSKKGWTTEADLLGGIRTDEQGLTETLNQPNTTVLKYTENGKIVGCVLLEQQTDKLYLGMLTVSPTLQGGGIGKMFLKAAEEVAQSLQINKITMTVVSVRKELIDWYKRHGYQETGETKPFPMNDPNFGLPKQFLEFIVMEKSIANVGKV
jgi:N-acetylglutamate synthase-like GNAT family acetyltransferase